MKLCKDCEYFTGSNFCLAPQNGLSPIDGTPKPVFATTSREPNAIISSDKTPHCGIEAKFFKAKDVKVNTTKGVLDWFRNWK